MATKRQIAAVDNLVENGGNVTQAMKEAKYSPATYNNPKVLTESDGYKELMSAIDKEITPELIAERHKELLNKRELAIVEYKKDGNSEVFEVLDQPDTQAVKAALDMSYKMKGVYKDNNTNIQVNIANVLKSWDDDQVAT